MHKEPVLTIDVVSDLVSPWCFLSKRRLDRALLQIGGASVPHVRWQPFEINPAIPDSGLDVDRYLSNIFGSNEAARTVLEQLTGIGEGDGIRFKFDRVRSVPNTMKAHRLILLAEEEALGGAAVDALFRAFFEEGRDIGRTEVLAELAGEIGLDAADVDAYLRGDRNRDAVRTREAHARSAGLTGVPSTVVNGVVAMIGVQEPETILSVIDKALFPDFPEQPDPKSLN
jgi:predicted DsbA family dithiol-disulfide isomerase